MEVGAVLVDIESLFLILEEEVSLFLFKVIL
jgi:hypothetical protein